MMARADETRVRRATLRDAAGIAALVNRAYEVERCFVDGDRTSTGEVRRLMRRGVFFVARAEDAIAGCVFVEIRGGAATFGLLAVDPARQGQGWGRRLIDAAEAHARQYGARSMEIQVVDARTDLFPLYERLGYRRSGTAPYVARPVTRPVQFVVMTKTLAANG